MRDSREHEERALARGETTNENVQRGVQRALFVADEHFILD